MLMCIVDITVVHANEIAVCSFLPYLHLPFEHVLWITSEWVGSVMLMCSVDVFITHASDFAVCLSFLYLHFPFEYCGLLGGELAHLCQCVLLITHLSIQVKVPFVHSFYNYIFLSITIWILDGELAQLCWCVLLISTLSMQVKLLYIPSFYVPWILWIPSGWVWSVMLMCVVDILIVRVGEIAVYPFLNLHPFKFLWLLGGELTQLG